LIKNSSDPQEAYDFLMQAYQNISYMPNTDESTLLTKLELRDMLIQSAPEADKESLQKSFSTQSLLEIMRKNAPLSDESKKQFSEMFPQISNALGNMDTFLNSAEFKEGVLNILSGSKQLTERAKEEMKKIEENAKELLQKKPEEILNGIINNIGQKSGQ